MTVKQASSPDPKAYRRWFQFSLRTLLLLTAALAVWLGMVTSSARRQERAVAEIRQFGGSVSYKTHVPRTIQVDGATKRIKVVVGSGDILTMEQKIPDMLVPSPSVVELRPLSPYQVEIQGKQPGVTNVTLWDPQGKAYTLAVTVEKLELAGPVWLRNLIGDDYFNSVEGIDFPGSSLTDADLPRLRGYLEGLNKLDSLNLSGLRITDAGLKHLEGLTRLKYLCFYNTRVTRDGVQKLEKALPNCTVVR